MSPTSRGPVSIFFSLSCARSFVEMKSANLVPFLVAEVIDIAKLRESCPASIVDNDIESAQLLDSLFDQPSDVIGTPSILNTASVQLPSDCDIRTYGALPYSLKSDHANAEFFSTLFGHLVGAFFVAHVVHSHISTLGGEPLTYHGT